MKYDKIIRNKTLILFIYIIIFCILLPGFLFLTGEIIDVFFPPFSILNLRKSGIFLFITGILLFANSCRYLLYSGKGLPVSHIPPKYLVEKGPYSWFRHPLYVGFHLMLIGSIHPTRGYLISCGPVFLIIWICYAVFFEEKKLLMRYQTAYNRYRKETGILLPDLYNIIRLIGRVLFFIFFRLDISGKENIPETGGFILAGIHRSYLDPFIMGAGINRKIYFLTTSSMFRNSITAIIFKNLFCLSLHRYRPDLKAIKQLFNLVHSGGIIGILPEGGRSWYGESPCNTAVFRIIQKPETPVVLALIDKGFDYYPRFRLLPSPVKLKLTYKVYMPGEFNAESIFRELIHKEEVLDSDIQKMNLPINVKGAEQIFYMCPSCKKLFSMCSGKHGKLTCCSCGKYWHLIAGKALLASDGNRITLRSVEEDNLSRLSSNITESLCFKGRISINFTKKTNGSLTLSKEKAALCILDKNDSVTFDIQYLDIISILIEGRKSLEISFTISEKQYYAVFQTETKYTLFLQHFLRLKSFGNPYYRFKNSKRIDLRSNVSQD